MPWHYETTRHAQRGLAFAAAVLPPCAVVAGGDGVEDGEEFNKTSLFLIGTKVPGASEANYVSFISNPTVKDTDEDGLADNVERDGWHIMVNGKSIFDLNALPDIIATMVGLYLEDSFPTNILNNMILIQLFLSKNKTKIIYQN